MLTLATSHFGPKSKVHPSVLPDVAIVDKLEVRASNRANTVG